MQVCVDASIALKLVLAEDDSNQARALWSDWVHDDVEIVAPYHLVFEVASVIRNNVYRKRLSPEIGREALAAFLAQDVLLLHPPDLLSQAWEIARAFDRPTMYDATYVALGVILDCDVWTADRRLHQAVAHAIPRLRWLADYQQPDRL